MTLLCVRNIEEGKFKSLFCNLHPMLLKVSSLEKKRRSATL